MKDQNSLIPRYHQEARETYDCFFVPIDQDLEVDAPSGVGSDAGRLLAVLHMVHPKICQRIYLERYHRILTSISNGCNLPTQIGVVAAADCIPSQ